MIYNNEIKGLCPKLQKKIAMNPYAFKGIDEAMSIYSKFSETGANPALEAILLKNGKPEEKKVLKSVDAQGILNLYDFTTNHLDKMDKMSLRTVYGATDKPLPLSAIAYAVSSLVIGKALASPKIDLMIADGAAIHLNKMNPKNVRQNTSLLFHVIKKYVDAFYPQIKDKVSFYHDTDFTTSLLESDGWKQAYPQMVAMLDKKPAVMKDIYGYSTQMGVGKEEADLYSNLHWPEHRVTFAEDAPAKHTNFFTGEKGLPPIEFNLSFGAKPEKDFNAVMNTTEPAFSKIPFVKPVPHAQIITDFSNAPYYPQKSGDITIEDAIKNPGLIKDLSSYNDNVKKGNEILAMGITKEVLMDFLNSMNTKSFQEEVMGK